MMAEIDIIIKQIEKLMYGYNFEVCIGIDIFNGTTNVDFEKSLKERYPKTNPNRHPLFAISNQELLNDIQEKLDYRGDGFGSGLKLSEKKEAKLKDLQVQYIDYIKRFISEQAKIFYYPDSDGIPGYPVFWDYRYVLFADNSKIVFIYGSSSD